MGDSELSEVEFTCFNEDLYAHTVANACKMTNLKSLSYGLPYEFGGDQFDAPYDQLAKSLATLKLPNLQLYPMSPADIKILAKGLPFSCITSLQLPDSD
jgi:hypothetical protein